MSGKPEPYPPPLPSIFTTCDSLSLYCRLLFWSEWLRNSNTNARIGRAFCDGSNVTYIRQHQLGWPNGLTIDVSSKTLWWCDAYFDV